MTSASLKDKPVRDLARLAKQHGVAGWHAMRKDQLIRALARKARSRPPVVAAARGGVVPPAPATRAAAPLRPAEDAQRLDTSEMTVDEAVAQVLDTYQQPLPT